MDNHYDAETIKALRAKTGLTQEKFAERLKVSTATVRKWEQGKARPSMLAKRQLDRLTKKGA